MKTKFDSELIQIASLTNKEVFKNTNSILNDFPWTTELGKHLFKDKDLPICNFEDPTLIALLNNLMIKEEMEGFLELVKDFKQIVDKKEIEIISDSVFKYYKSVKVREIVNNNFENVDNLVAGIKGLPDTTTIDIPLCELGSVDIDKVIEEEIGSIDNILPSNFQLIRDSNPFNGYLLGQVVQVVGPPGRGKSAFMLFEIAGMAIMNYKILWLALGDLTKFDFVTRFTSVLTSTDYYKVASHPSKYFTDDVKQVANNIDLITIPAGKITSKQFLNYINHSDKRYDVIVVDYDSNFNQQSEDNMYHQGAEIYNDMTEVARPTDGQKSRLVFIASQPKIHFYNELKIPLEGAGESSRKQHIIDLMITLGTAGSDRPAGILHLPKVRRGKAGGSVPYVMNDDGKFEEITKEQLAMLRTYTN